MQPLHTPQAHTQLAPGSVQIWAASERINQVVIEHLDVAAWSARLATGPRANTRGNTRNIAAIFTHMHNVRCKWVRLNAPHVGVPALLKRARCTPKEASAALAESAARCGEMLAEALGGSDTGESRIQHFHRDSWARPWPISREGTGPGGLAMFCYMLTHEAHHRGQVCMLAHQLGFPLPEKVTAEMWNWEKLWK